jgi:hypothetical protein
MADAYSDALDWLADGALPLLWPAPDGQLVLDVVRLTHDGERRAHSHAWDDRAALAVELLTDSHARPASRRPVDGTA